MKVSEASTRRPDRRVRAGVAVFLMALTAPLLAAVATPSAFAGSGSTSGTSDSSPGPRGQSNPGTTGGGSGPSGAVFGCIGDNFGDPSHPNYLSWLMHPRCTNPQGEWTPQPGSSGKACPAGFQVFRFYGNQAEPAKAMTVSYANFHDYCEGDERAAAFWSTSAYDAKVVIDDANKLRADGDGDQAFEFGRDSFSGRSSGPVFDTQWVSSRIQRGTAKLPTAARPAFKPGDQTCLSSRVANPFRAYLGNPEVSEVGRQKVRNYLYNMYDSLNQHMGANSARKEIGVRDFIFNAEGVVTGLTWLEDTQVCGSPAEYVATDTVPRSTTTPVAQQRQNRITGTCYIPVERAALPYTAPRNGGGVRTKYAFPTLRNSQGLRYSTHYEGGPYTHRNFFGLDNTTAVPGSSWEGQVAQGWRDRMTEWYRGQVAGNDMINYHDGANTHQILPAGPYRPGLGVNYMDDPGNRSVDQDFAVAALKKASKCWFGSQHQYQSLNRVPQPPPVMEGTVTLQDKPVLHAGGATPNSVSSQKFRLDTTTATCVANCTDANIQVTDIDARISLRGPAGYEVCTLAESRDNPNCAFAVKSGIDHGELNTCTAGNDNACTFTVNNTNEFELVFFRPTEDLQRVSIGVAVPAVNFIYDVVSPVHMTFNSVWSPGRQDYTYGQAETERQVASSAFEPSVAGSPRPLTRQPGQLTHWYEAPVIGAVASGF